MGHTLPGRGTCRDGRPVQPAVHDADQNTAGGGETDRGRPMAPTPGAAQIAGELGMPASTVHAVLVRCRINRLARLDRVTGEPIRRYEHPTPGR